MEVGAPGPRTARAVWRGLRPALFIWALLGVVSPALAQIVTDGSVGAAQSLVGPNFVIPATLGTRAGANLFHSFSTFNIPTGDTATFTGPSGISNVISRVTGGTASTIDGLLASTIPGANFWFLNPAGVIFGPNAQVNVPASLYVTTADEIQFQDGAKFGAGQSMGSSLTTAAPQAFGFLGTSPGAITITGSQLRVADGSTLALVGGDITINNPGVGNLIAYGGEVDLLSVSGAPATVALNSASSSNGFAGHISITDLVPDGNLDLDTSGNGSGLIRIRAGTFVNDGGLIQSDNVGNNDKVQAIDVAADHVTLLDGGYLSSVAHAGGSGGAITITTDDLDLTDSQIDSFAMDAGAAGPITIAAKSMTIKASAAFPYGSSGIYTAAFSSGAGGNISVSTDDLQIANGGFIETDSYQTGAGGSIAIAAKTMIIDGTGDNADGGLITKTYGFGSLTGPGGSVNVSSDSLQILGGGIVESSSAGDGAGGSITIASKTATIDGLGIGANGGLITQANGSIGPGGPVSVTSDDLQILRGGSIQSTVSGYGTGGSITIAAERMTVDASGTEPSGLGASYIESDAGLGPAGAITVTSDDLRLINGGAIDGTSGLGGAGTSITIAARRMTVAGMGGPVNARIVTTTIGEGGPGSVVIASDDLQILDHGEIESSSFGDPPAGNISIIVSGLMTMRTANVEAITLNNRNGGQVSITANALDLRDSEILSSSGQTDFPELSNGNAGNVILRSNAVVLDDSSIIANAVKGNGGNITIDAQQILQRGGVSSLIDASSDDGGINGTINLSAPNVNATTGIVALSTSFTDTGSLLGQTCAARAADAGSSLIAAGRGGLGPSFDGLGSNSLFVGSNMTTADNALRSTAALLPSLAISRVSAAGCR